MWQPVSKDWEPRAVPLVVELRFEHRIGDYCDTLAPSETEHSMQQRGPSARFLLFQLCFCKRGALGLGL